MNSGRRQLVDVAHQRVAADRELRELAAMNDEAAARRVEHAPRRPLRFGGRAVDRRRLLLLLLLLLFCCACHRRRHGRRDGGDQVRGAPPPADRGRGKAAEQWPAEQPAITWQAPRDRIAGRSSRGSSASPLASVLSTRSATRRAASHPARHSFS